MRQWGKREAARPLWQVFDLCGPRSLATELAVPMEHHAVGMAKPSTSRAAMAKNAILQLEERSPHNGSGTKGLFKAL